MTPEGPRTPNFPTYSRRAASYPAGVDRRAFMMRSALVGAVAVLRDAPRPTPQQQTAAPASGAPAARRPAAVRRPRRREEGQRAGDDDARRVLQGRARAVELAHDRPDAHHLRLLPALHEAAGRPARQGDRAEGAPVRQPERHRARATAPSARRWPASSARSRRRSIRCSSTAARQAGPDLPGEARRQDLQRVAEGHHLRRAEGRLPAPEHDDLQADGGRRRCCSSRSTTRSAAASSSGRATSRRRRAQPKYPYATMKELQAHAREEQALDRAGRDGERGGGLRQERGRDQRVHRQDHDGDGQHRQVGL